MSHKQSSQLRNIFEKKKIVYAGVNRRCIRFTEETTNISQMVFCRFFPRGTCTFCLIHFMPNSEHSKKRSSNSKKHTFFPGMASCKIQNKRFWTLLPPFLFLYICFLQSLKCCDCEAINWNKYIEIINNYIQVWLGLRVGVRVKGRGYD